MVAAVVLVFVFIFCTVLLFHLVQQNRYNTATQLESIARSVREPLSSAILKGDIPEAEAILASIKPAGVVSRADVVLPNQFQALRKSFIPERPVPVMVTRLFELPVQISLGVYSLERPANPQPIAYLVLQADSFRMYKFVMSTLSTLVTIYLLLSLILTVAISWCINRLILHPLRNIARELNAIPPRSLLVTNWHYRVCIRTMKSVCWCAVTTSTSNCCSAIMKNRTKMRCASRCRICRTKPC